ncbi:hypothetical protein G6F56_008867 [Rhizopus delemar]|nr:hypothetical protein G6F56_008867 [Rhizopus delemar]
MTEYEPSPILPIGSGEKSLAQSLVQKQEVNLWHRPEDPFSHPIQGELNETSKLLAKITRKIKRNKLTGEVVETSSDWSVEIIGSVNHVVRFRALADLQYIVPKENRINKLTEALNVGNGKNKIKKK